MSDLQPQERTINRFSITLATLATFFAALYMIPREAPESGTVFLGFLMNFSIIGAVPVALMLLCAGGCVWIFATHPTREKFVGKPWILLPNTVLPSLATLITSTVLIQLERNTIWWFALLVGLIIIGVILDAEFRVLSPAGEAYNVVAPLLISLGFSLFLILTITLAASKLRMYVQFVLILFAAFFIAYRTISLRKREKVRLPHVLVCGITCAEIAAAMYYLFLKPVQSGLVLTGLLYILTALVVLEEPIQRNKLIEPLVMTVLLVILIVVVSLT